MPSCKQSINIHEANRAERKPNEVGAKGNKTFFHKVIIINATEDLGGRKNHNFFFFFFFFVGGGKKNFDIVRIFPKVMETVMYGIGSQEFIAPVLC